MKDHIKKILHWDDCKECGECLSQCRYIDLSKEEAAEEVKKLNQGKDTRITEECKSCYSCNAFCKNNAHPYEKILYKWNDRNIERGIPRRAKYIIPGERPNFREDLNYSAVERELHKKWASDEPPARTVLYPGCNLLSMPHLAQGIIFEKLPVWGKWDLCCGELYFRMGLINAVQKTAHKLTEYYKDKKIDEMVFLCSAGYNMFTNVLPKHFGAEFNFKKIFFTDWLLKELERGSFRIKEKLKGSAVLHDPCHARILGDEFMERQRRLLELIGLKVFETPGNKKEGLCCGIAAACGQYSIMDFLRQGYRQLKILDKAPGDIISVYCTGCLLTLSSVRFFRPFGKKIYHTIELLRKALGEDVPRMNMKRARAITRGILLHVMPHYLSRKKISSHLFKL